MQSSPLSTIRRRHTAESAQEVSRKRLSLQQVLNLDSSCLRGVPLSTLLARCAWLFSSGGEAARKAPGAVFALSRTVHRLDFFISHAWVSQRLAKWLALVFYLNFRSALCALLLTNFGLFWISLHYFELMPDAFKLRVVSFLDMSEHRALCFCMLPIGFTCFMLTLTTAHNFLWRSQSGFLDIACVSQEDEQKKAAGIASLGAVLARSEYMIALVDEHYWRRLWCMFEVAAFCHHADASRIVVLPLHGPFVALGFALSASFLGWGVMLLNSLEIKHSGESFTVMFALGLVMQPVVLFAFLLARRSHKAFGELRDFSIADAQCLMESDREAILCLIGDWFTDTHAGETQEDRLQALGRLRFEAFVRHSLGPRIARQENESHTRTWLISFGCSFHGIALTQISAPTVSVIHAACLVVIFTFVGLFMYPTLSMFQSWAWTATFSAEDWLVPRVKRRRAARAAIYVVGAAVAACSFPLYINARLVCATPNQLLSPLWQLPDDGFDAETRRYLKHYLVLIWHLGVILTHFIGRK